MKLTFTLLAAAALSLGVAAESQALTITPTTGTINVTRWEGNQTGQSAIDAVIAAYLGGAVELYKKDVPSTESGSLAGSYNTTFANTATDPEDATITYVGGNYISGTSFALVKDGNQEPAWYLFKLSSLDTDPDVDGVQGWDGKEILNFMDFWPTQGAISHVSLYGTTVTDPNDPGPPTSAPDGGSVAMLLGISLMGLAGARRFLN